MGRGMKIERFDGEFGACVEIHNACWPNYRNTEAVARAWDAVRPEGCFYRRLMAWEGTRLLGFGQVGHQVEALHERQFYVSVDVRPEARGRGVGGGLYEALLAQLSAFEVGLLKAETLENHERAREMLVRRGFELVLREPVSRVQVAEVALERFAERVGRAAKAVRIITRAAFLAEDPEHAMRRYWALHMETRKDMPRVGTATEVPFEAFMRRMEIPGLNAEASFVALDGELLVGCTELVMPPADPSALRVAYTGVLRSHRRRGIAMALKVRALEFALEVGAQTIQTDNEENNPMYQINLKLGFVPQPAWLCYTLTS